jgi:anti-sigma B factor antagonist
LTKVRRRGRLTCMEVSDRVDQPIVEEGRRASFPAFLVTTGGGGRLRLAGELDIAGVPALRALLADVSGDVELDCSALTFIDCAGLRVLEETQHACEAAGGRLCLIAPSRFVTWLLDLTGLDGFFDVRGGSKS